MAKLQMKDLTPELLSEMKELKTGEEVKEFLAGKDLEISDNGAQTIASHIAEGDAELSEEQLAAVAGGCSWGKPYGGTRIDR